MADGNLLLTNIGQLVTNDPSREGLLGLVADAAVAVVDEHIAWVGPDTDVPEQWAHLSRIDCRGGAVVPGFVDAHTHLAFSGDRADEFGRFPGINGTAQAWRFVAQKYRTYRMV